MQKIAKNTMGYYSTAYDAANSFAILTGRSIENYRVGKVLSFIRNPIASIAETTLIGLKIISHSKFVDGYSFRRIAKTIIKPSIQALFNIIWADSKVLGRTQNPIRYLGFLGMCSAIINLYYNKDNEELDNEKLTLVKDVVDFIRMYALGKWSDKVFHLLTLIHTGLDVIQKLTS